VRKDRSSSLGRGWSGRSTGWEWSGGRGGAGRLTGLILMVLVGGRASVRNAAETFGLDYANLLEALGELGDAWRSCRGW
jgi:hypothetical protein